MKYDFTQYVTKDSVMALDGRNKLEVMDQLITRAADLTKLSRDVIFRLTWKREQMMTTGVGGMLALPHIRVNDINRPYVLVGVCENPIEDYQGQDDQPVRVIVFTVAPDALEHLAPAAQSGPDRGADRQRLDAGPDPRHHQTGKRLTAQGGTTP